MLDKRLWPNVIYAAILLVVCVSIWQMTAGPEQPSVPAYSLYSSNSSTYLYPMKTLPPGDYHRLIDLQNFTFTVLNLPCNDSNLLLLVLVHSNPKNFETRKIVRETWGQNTFQVKVLFMTGLITEGDLKVKVDKENERFGDMVQGSFIDAYRNMTYKHVMVFKFAIYHCPQAKYILKTDDDVFVNMPLMVNFLTSDLSPFGGSKMLFCNLRRQELAVRSYRSKWRVSFKEYPARIYPPYCPGWVILYSPDVVFDLYKEAQKADYFWIDDVHITGTLASKIDVSHVNTDNVVLTKRAMRNGLYQPSSFNQSFLFGTPNVNNIEIKLLWEIVKNHDTHVSLRRAISSKYYLNV